MGSKEAIVESKSVTERKTDSQESKEALQNQSQQLRKEHSLAPTIEGETSKQSPRADLPKLEIVDREKSVQDDTTKVVLKDGRILTYDKEGTLIAAEKDGKRWELKYDGDTLVRYQGPNSYVEYQKEGWQRCTANGCKKIEGFTVKDEDGVETVLVGRVTKQDLADPGSVKFADIPEIASSSQRMIDLIRSDGAEGAIKYFAQTLPNMDSEQLVQLEKNYFATTGKSLLGEFDALKNEGKLSPASAEILSSFLTKGSDKRTPQETAELGMKALSEPNARIAVTLFGGALGGNTEQAIEARKLFNQMDGDNKIAQASLGTTSTKELQDIMQWGAVNPATVIRDAFGYTSSVFGLNEGTIDNIISSMSKQERDAYLEGERLSKINGPYTSDQEKSISYYESVHSALVDASARTENVVSRQRQYDLQSERKLMGWEDMIRNGGQKDLVAQITDCKGSPEQVISVLRGMNKDQWDRLKSDKNYSELVKRAIQSNFNAPDQSWGYDAAAQNELTRILDKNNYADGVRVSKDRFFEEIGLRGSGTFVAQTCERGDSTFTKAIKTDAEYREKVLGVIMRRTNADSPERALALDAINAIVEDRVDSKVTSLKRSILKGLIADQPSMEMAASVRTALKNSPELKEQIASNPDLANELKGFLAKGLKGGIKIAEKLLAGQGLTTDDVKFLASSSHMYVGKDQYGKDKVMSESILSKADAINGLALLDENQPGSIKSIDKFSAEEQKVADAVAQQGKVQPEDNLRLFVLSMNNGALERVRTTFNDLDDVAKKKAIDAYSAKYGGDLLKDAMGKVSDPAERTQLQQALTLRARTSLGTLSRGLEDKANAENVSSFGRSVTEIIAGNSYTQADKNAINNSLTVKELAEKRDNLSEADRKRLDEALANISKAAQDIRDGKKQAVETLEKGVMVAGAILAIPMTAGYSGVALLAGSATLIGLSEVVLRKQIKGADYSKDDLVKDAVILGSSILIDAAPAISGVIVRGVTSDGKALLRAGVKSEELRNELRDVIKLAAKDKAAAEEGLRTVANKYALEGKEEALFTRLQNDLSSSAKRLKQANQDRVNTVTAVEQTPKKPDPNNFYKLKQEKELSSTQKMSNDTSFVRTDARQDTVWGKGNAVKLTGAKEDFVIEGFERTTGNAIVRPAKSAEQTVKSEVTVATSDLQKQGYMKVSENMDMYIKDGVVFKGRVQNDSTILSTTDMQIVPRERLVPPNATTSMTERIPGSKDPWDSLPLSGEDHYRLLTYLERAKKDGLTSLNIAESNEMSALLKRVRPEDTIVSDALKTISVEDKEMLINGAYIKYNQNMPKPGDMRDFKSVVTNQQREFPSLADGAENLEKWDYGKGVALTKKQAREYELTNGSKIVIPEDVAKQLDKVRELRKILETRGTTVSEILERMKARVQLQLSPFRDHPLPEEIGRMILETPNPARIKTYMITGTSHPEDLYNRARMVKNGMIPSGDNIPASTFIGNDFIQLYPAGTRTGMSDQGVANIFLSTNHEWSHNAEKGLFFDAYKVAREVEELPVPSVARQYALTDEHEDWAVMFGENIMTDDPKKLVNMAEQTPLRSIALTNALRQELEAAGNSATYAPQLLERIKLIEQTAMPKAQKILQEMTRSGDPAVVKRAIEYMAAINKADPNRARVLADYEGVLKVFSTTQDKELAAEIVPLIKPYLKSRPELFKEVVDQAATLNFNTYESYKIWNESNDVTHRISAANWLLSHYRKDEILAFQLGQLTKDMPNPDAQKIFDTIVDTGYGNKGSLLNAIWKNCPSERVRRMAAERLAGKERLPRPMQPTPDYNMQVKTPQPAF
jgi:hypothetical protein